ncbi:recombinase family protein [Thermodesulfobacteriota bacterium]
MGVSMSTKRKRACGYARVSTQGQVKKGTSLEDQKRQIIKYCDLNEWNLVKIYQDAGLSGSATERPALTKLMEHSLQKKYDVVVFHSLDRLGRSMLHLLQLFEDLLNNDIAIACITQPFLNSTEGTFGKLIRQIFSSLCEFERNLTAKRTRAGRRNKIEAGKAFPGKTPYGYLWNSELKKIEIDKERAEIYKKIVDLYLIDRLSTLKIAKYLSEKRIPSPMSRIVKDKSKIKYRWTSGTVLRILKHPAYAGLPVAYLKNEYRQVTPKTGKTYFTPDKEKLRDQEPIKIKFPALVKKERWDAIQKRLDFNKRKPKKLHMQFAKDHFLANAALGLHFRCGLCNTSIMSRVIRRKKDGPVRLRYQCNLHVASADQLITSGKERCNLPSMDSDKIDEIVWHNIKSILSDPVEFGREWLRKPNQQKILKEAELLNKQKNKLLKEIDTLCRRTGEDFSDKFLDGFLRRQKEVEQELDDIEAQINIKNRELESVSIADEFLQELEQEIKDAKQIKIQARKNRDPSNPRKAVIRIESIAKKLDKLDFETKKQIIESIISPETGGYIKLELRPLADFSTKGLPTGTVDTLVPRVVLDADIDILRLKNIIELLQVGSLDKNGIFKTHQSKPMR